MAHGKASAPVLTNAEGLPIRPPSKSGKWDRIQFILYAAMQLLAVGIIAKQLKAFGVLPAWVDTDFSAFAKFIPRNPWIVPPCGHLPSRNVFIVSENIVFPDGIGPGAIHIKRTQFKKVYKQKEVGQAAISQAMQTIDNLGGTVLVVGNLMVSPGVIDVHVHFNEPGRAGWEGIMRGTYAAAAGGISTVVDMPLNNNPTITTPALLSRKLQKIWDKSRIGMAVWAGLVPGNAHNSKDLDKMLAMGAVGLKAFMSPSGINDFPTVSRNDIEAALPVLLWHRKALMLHAEILADVDGVCGSDCNVRSHRTWELTRPEDFEINAARAIVAAMRTTKKGHPELWHNVTSNPASSFGVHIAHLSSIKALPIYTEARQEGMPITVETCPHYLHFTTDDIPDGNTLFKCAPPLRSNANREALIGALENGTIDLVASDHSPAPVSMKQLETGDFMSAWGGISGMQYLLPALNTVARERSWKFEKLANLLSLKPAKLAGLADRKGSIREGLDADLVIWDPYASANTTKAANQHRHKVSPWIDAELMGKVHATFVEGAMVYGDSDGVYTKRICGGTVLRKE